MRKMKRQWGGDKIEARKTKGDWWRKNECGVSEKFKRVFQGIRAAVA